MTSPDLPPPDHLPALSDEELHRPPEGSAGVHERPSFVGNIAEGQVAAEGIIRNRLADRAGLAEKGNPASFIDPTTGERQDVHITGESPSGNHLIAHPEEGFSTKPWRLDPKDPSIDLKARPRRPLR